MKFHHIGIFVPSIDEGRRRIEAMFPIERSSEVFEDDALAVKVQFFWEESGICYEIVAPLGDKNPVSQLLTKRTNLLNHVAYLVTDMDAALRKMNEAGCLQITQPTPAVAFDLRPVCFLMTRLGFVVELIEMPE